MKIGIIGGGAAGMMAAATIVEEGTGAEVVLIEKNPGLGRKVIISGGGRCNVTTGVQTVREVLKRYPRGSAFLNAAMYGFPPAHVYEWFEAHGVPLKTEDDLRVFPQSNDGKDIVGVFEHLLSTASSTVLLKEQAKSIQKKNTQYIVTLQSGKTITCDRLIMTTGGEAYRHTGSTGDGYTFAESLGHTITPLAPSLNSFIVQEQWVKELSGVSFQDVGLSVEGRKEFTARGPIVLTHKGVSGPALFALSSQVAFEKYTKEQPLPLRIDFVPDETMEQMRDELDRKIAYDPKQLYEKTIAQWVPKSVARALLSELNVQPDLLNASVSKEVRTQTIHWLMVCPLNAVGRGAGSEFVTAGGVDTAEVNPSTMESKISPGLFFAGEIVNVDGFTGGFNLQASWATGRLAGYSAMLP